MGFEIKSPARKVCVDRLVGSVPSRGESEIVAGLCTLFKQYSLNTHKPGDEKLIGLIKVSAGMLHRPQNIL
jgi:hypothetical protein